MKERRGMTLSRQHRDAHLSPGRPQRNIGRCKRHAVPNGKIEVEGVAAMLALQQLLSRVGDAFLAAHERLDELIAEARHD